MKILFLGPPREHLVAYLKSFGDEVATFEGPIDEESDVLQGAEFLVSYGYRHLLKAPVLRALNGRAINLHVSLLPWNRGADPNLWSFLEGTPKGVTIHLIDEGLDTGAIIAQRELPAVPDDTLRTSYERLSGTIEALFQEIWPRIRSGEFESCRQNEPGTYHRRKDRKAYEHLLTQGWDTPVARLIRKACQPVCACE